MDLYTSYSDMLFNYTHSAGSLLTTGGRFGAGGWQTDNGQAGIGYVISSQTDVWISFAMKLVSVVNADYYLASWVSAAGVEGVITYNPTTGALKAWSGNQSSLLATGAFNLNNGWHWLDLHYKYDTTVGVMEVWVDDLQAINLTGANTTHNASQTITTVWVGSTTSNTCPMVVDDVFIYTPGTRLGDSRIVTLVPSSDVSPNNGTPLSGTSHYGAVDEAQWASSNYITMPNTSGDKEVYGQPGLSTTPVDIWSVKVTLVSEKTDAGAFNLEPLIISSGTESDGTSQALTTSWGSQNAIYAVDPHTSAAWTAAGVNAAQIGFKVP